MNLREVPLKYGLLVVYISLDSAVIWEFGYELTLGIGNLKYGQHRCFRA
jgi:hypothetical protein